MPCEEGEIGRVCNTLRCLQELEGLTGGMAAAVDVSESVSGRYDGNDDSGIGFGTGGLVRQARVIEGTWGFRIRRFWELSRFRSLAG